MGSLTTRRALATAALAAALVLAGVFGSGAGPVDAASSVRFTTGRFDSAGSDNGSNTSLNGEWISVKNFGSKAVSLKGWKIKDKAGHTYTFAAFTLQPGKSVKLLTGSGTNSSTARYWGEDWYIWNNTGDTAYLKNAAGSTVDSCQGKGSAVTC